MHNEHFDEKDIYQRAKERVEERIGFFWHFIAYIIVNGALVLIWYFTGGGEDYFWPMWPLLGWGIGMLFHFASVFLGEGLFRDYRERKIRQFMEKEKRMSGDDTKFE